MKSNTQDSNSFNQQYKQTLKQQRPKTSSYSKPLLLSSSVQKSPLLSQQNLSNEKPTVKKIQSSHNSSKFISINNQSRAFIQSIVNHILDPVMLDDQSRAFVQSSLTNRVSTQIQLSKKLPIQETQACSEYSKNISNSYRLFGGKILRETHKVNQPYFYNSAKIP